jgi:hypothetical protein
LRRFFHGHPVVHRNTVVPHAFVSRPTRRGGRYTCSHLDPSIRHAVCDLWVVEQQCRSCKALMEQETENHLAGHTSARGGSKAAPEGRLVMSAVRKYFMVSLMAVSALFVVPVTTRAAQIDDGSRASAGFEMVRWVRPYYRPYYRPYVRPYYYGRYYYGRPYYGQPYYGRPYYSRPYYQPYYRPYYRAYRPYYF